MVAHVCLFALLCLTPVSVTQVSMDLESLLYARCRCVLVSSGLCWQDWVWAVAQWNKLSDLDPSGMDTVTLPSSIMLVISETVAPAKVSPTPTFWYAGPRQYFFGLFSDSLRYIKVLG